MDKKTNTKQNILNAAVKEFAHNPYHIATTNVIAKNAGVSKGSVFLHFKSKKELYISCLRYLLQKSGKEAEKQGFEEKGDVFDRITAISQWKLKRFKEYPEEYLFVYRALYYYPTEIKEEIAAELGQFSQQAEKQYIYTDKKSGYGKYTEKQIYNIIQIINMGTEAKFRRGLGNEINENDISGYFTEWLELIEIIKKGLKN